MTYPTQFLVHMDPDRRSTEPATHRGVAFFGVVLAAFLTTFVFLGLLVAGAKPAHPSQLFARPQLQTVPHTPVTSHVNPTRHGMAAVSSADSNVPGLVESPVQTAIVQGPTELSPVLETESRYPNFLNKAMVAVGSMGLLVGFFVHSRSRVAMATSAGQLDGANGNALWKPGHGYSTELAYAANPEQSSENTFRRNLGRFMLTLGAMLTGASVFFGPQMLMYPDILLSCVFVAGYCGIIFEEQFTVNKSGVGLVMTVALWTIRSLLVGPGVVHHELEGALAEAGEILFFLMGAMTIVEIVDSHQGFNLITNKITTRNKKTLMWLIGGVTFFLSAILDNLTSTIVMISLLRKILPGDSGELRKLLGAVVVIAANAGGAWTPMGDVTTTMLWIGGQITTVPIMLSLILPSLVAMAVPLALMGAMLKEFQGELPPAGPEAKSEMAPKGKLVFGCGLAALCFVPLFKFLTGMPPYLGMLGGLGMMWLLTDIIHYGEKERSYLKAPSALSKIDHQGILFFLGILMSVAALQSSGILVKLAEWLGTYLPMRSALAAAIGLASAVIDNVPLVAATMGMYSLDLIPVNNIFWQLVAYCAGTGGSILIIGSAAGVAFMGMEKADFGWYTKRISFFAMAGYFAGMAAYFAFRSFFVFA